MSNMGRKRANGVTDEQILDLYREVRAGRKVATALGVSERTVYAVLRKHDVEADGLARYRKNITRFQGQEAEIRAWYESGMTHDEIRERLGGASDYAIKHAIKRAGGELRPNPVPTVRPGEAERIAELLASGMSQAAIGRELGRSQAFVWRVLRQRGLLPKQRSPEIHGKWAGGRMRAGAYWRVRIDLDDPMSSMANNQGYVLEHRLVIARQIGRPLLPHETVHHINGDGADNRPENLQLRQGRHGKGVALSCIDCGSHNIKAVPLAD